MFVGLEIKHKIVKFFDHKLVLFEPFVSNVEDRVLVGRLVVHVEDYMGLRNRHNRRDVPRTRFDSVLAYRYMHVSSVTLEVLHRRQRGQMFRIFWLESIPVVPLQGPTHEPIFERSRIIFLRFYHLASQLNSFISLRGEVINVHTSGMDQHAHSVRVGSVGVGSI